MNQFFGPPWNAPFIDSAVQVPTPMGEECATCGESIGDGDQGMIFPGVQRLLFHRGCFLLGVIGHIARQCECFEGKGSLRERGLATIAWIDRQRMESMLKLPRKREVVYRPGSQPVLAPLLTGLGCGLAGFTWDRIHDLEAFLLGTAIVLIFIGYALRIMEPLRIRDLWHMLTRKMRRRDPR